MTGLFEAMDYVGSYRTRHYSLADIESVGRAQTQKGVEGEWWSVRRRGDLDAVYLSEAMWQALMRRPIQMLPADPALSVVNFGCDEEGPWSTSNQVLSWALCFDGEMRPVTRDGVDGDLPFWSPIYIQMADGTLEAGPHCDRLDSVEAGLAMAKRDWDAKNAAEIPA